MKSNALLLVNVQEMDCMLSELLSFQNGKIDTSGGNKDTHIKNSMLV